MRNDLTPVSSILRTSGVDHYAACAPARVQSSLVGPPVKVVGEMIESELTGR